MPRLTTILVWLSLISTKVSAFQSTDVSNRHRVGSVISGTVLQESQCSDQQDNNLQARRSFLSKIALVPLVALPALSVTPEPAQASGGATAGGAYLLSAKKRYYERVKTSVKGLLAAVEELKNGNSKVAKEYFASEADGSWKDLTAAGYLLSNAFRRSSSTAPDSLPAVKKYKAFAKEVEGLQKALKKKGAAAAVDAFPSVETALEDWLSEIELPPSREL